MSARHARHTDAGAGLRLLRAAVFAAVCVVLSALGHVLAACATVPWWTLLAGFLGVFAVAAPLAGRERSLPSIAGALAAGQLGLHTLFGIGQHTAAASGNGATGDTSLLRLAAKLVCGPAASAQLTASDARRIVTDAGLRPPSGAASAAHGPMAGMPGMADSVSAHGAMTGLLPSLPMLLGHLLAALLTGWLLRRGEAALFRLVRLSAQAATTAAEGACARSLRAALGLVRALLAGLPGAPGHGPRLVLARLATPLPPAGEALQHSVIRRGPPAVFTLAA
ncbi:hypothetical protein [Streptomyces melanogenes]|uniref:hypothetical protein n=1 Tax=Streptomyces melanogenes TaxID=67326 RepID=UPI00167E8944|nr:hypothetical protein [Streptomyces melanogenes]GGP69404.1 hypothetical protein GCM10010278_53670 [Streptomyces melanogenes]